LCCRLFNMAKSKQKAISKLAEGSARRLPKKPSKIIKEKQGGAPKEDLIKKNDDTTENQKKGKQSAKVDLASSPPRGKPTKIAQGKPVKAIGKGKGQDATNGPLVTLASRRKPTKNLEGASAKGSSKGKEAAKDPPVGLA